jgi:hypothetical protein
VALAFKQMFRLDPNQLDETQFRAVERRCQLVEIVAKYNEAGLESLPNDECRVAIEAIDDLGTALFDHAGYLALREACQRRLSDESR